MSNISPILLDSWDFAARWDHDHWTASPCWLHIGSDLAIGAAYIAIPAVLAYFVLRRRDVPFCSMFCLFGAFILACGATHVLDALTFWHPMYRLWGILKLVTAIISWVTLLALFPMLPKALKLPRLAAINTHLENEIAERKRAVEALLRIHDELETRVDKRTAELQHANAVLQEEICQRQRAEESLRASEARYQFANNRLNGIIEGTQDQIAALDLEFRFIAFNGAFQREFQKIFGKTVELGMSLTDALAHLPEEQANVRRHWTRAFAGEEFTVIEEFGDEGLQRHYYEIAYSAIRDEQGARIGASQIVRDLSERELVDFFENSAVPLHWTGPNGIIQRANRAELELLGYSREEYLGRNIADFHLDQDVITNLLARLAANETLRNCEARLRCKDGSIRHVLITENVLRQDGKFIHTRCVTRDVTDIKRVEAALRASESSFRQLADAMPQIVWSATPSGQVDYYNRRWYEFTGFTGQNQNWQSILHPDDLEECLKRWGDSAETAEKLELECRLMGASGQYRWHLGRAVPVCDESGAIIRWYGTCTDIDEFKQTQEALIERARELVVFNAKLSRSNQELDDFAYVASHDLREPLRGISNYASFLIEDYSDKLDVDGNAKLHTLRQLSQRLDSLIDSMLEYSRVGRVEMALRETDLNHLVEEVLDSLRIMLHEREVEIRIPRQLPSIRCDHVRTAELFRNLITNAIKYNDKPQKWIEIGFCDPADQERAQFVREFDSPPDTCAQSAELTFFVRDNGIGILEKHHATIFRIFKRLHGRDRFGGGTGAGLTIVKKIVERHQGRIWVESTFGEGSTFHFMLRGGIAS